MSVFSGNKEEKEAESFLLPVQDESAAQVLPTGPELPLAGDAAFPVNRERLSQMQKADPTLQECFAKVVSNNKARDEKVAYIMDGEMLLRK